jgi:hypothetical protein
MKTTLQSIAIALWALVALQYTECMFRGTYSMPINVRVVKH